MERFKKHECISFISIYKAKYRPDGTPLPVYSTSALNFENIRKTNDIVAVINVKLKNPDDVQQAILRYKYRNRNL